jgi:quinohemoprotein amine dehydrogenase beta subunit
MKSCSQFAAVLATAVLIAGGLTGCDDASGRKEYLVAANKPNSLHLVDTQSHEVIKSFPIPGDGAPGTISVSPDGSVAYVITNHMDSIAGINLDSGEQVFRADASDGDMRIKHMFAMTVSRDGSEIYSFQTPVRILSGDYQVMDTQIAVYKTDGGLNAKPVRVFPAPRQIAVMAPSTDGKLIYCIGPSIYAIDVKSGEIVNEHPLREWGRPNYGVPDVLAAWPHYEMADVLTTPYFVPRTDKAPDAPDAYKTGLITVDLASGEVTTEDFENTSVLIFSTVLNPMNREEAFGVYTQLTKIDRVANQVSDRVDMDHTFYAINISGDGKTLYMGGTMDDIVAYDAATLKQIWAVKVPGGGDQGLASLRVVRR